MRTFAKGHLLLAAFLPLGLLFEVDWQRVVGRPTDEGLRIARAAFEADTLRDKRHAHDKAGCEKGAKDDAEDGAKEGRDEGAADRDERQAGTREIAATRIAS
jgi:hypothetical protein